MSVQSVSRRRESQIVAIMFVTWGTVFLDRMAVLYLLAGGRPEMAEAAKSGGGA